jgi:hypothetical protein
MLLAHGQSFGTVAWTSNSEAWSVGRMPSVAGRPWIRSDCGARCGSHREESPKARRPRKLRDASNTVSPSMFGDHDHRRRWIAKVTARAASSDTPGLGRRRAPKPLPPNCGDRARGETQIYVPETVARLGRTMIALTALVDQHGKRTDLFGHVPGPEYKLHADALYAAGRITCGALQQYHGLVDHKWLRSQRNSGVSSRALRSSVRHTVHRSADLWPRYAGQRRSAGNPGHSRPAE